MQPSSSRLNYSFITEKDIDDLYQLDQDPAVMKYLNGGKPTTMEEKHTVFLPRMAKYANKEKGWGLWKVNIKESGEFIGWILVRPMHFFNDETDTEWHNLELGWRFKQSSWGKGYATEAANALVEQIALMPEYTHISAIALKENVGSIGVMEKLGMTFVKEYMHNDPLGDIPAVYYERKL